MSAIVKTKFLNDSELPKALIDLDARRKGIGGSDIAAVLGVSPYKSAYTAGLVLFYWVN